MAISVSKVHAIRCGEVIPPCTVEVTWTSEEFTWPTPIPRDVEQGMRDAGWAAVRDWRDGPVRWLCPEHGARRVARLERARMLEPMSRLAAGFELYDRVAARRVLDERLGAVMRVDRGWLQLSRLALDLLEGLATASAVRRRGVLLAYAPDSGRVAVCVAPEACDQDKRQQVLMLGSFQDGARVSPDWPMAVRAVEFLEVYGLLTDAGPVPVEVAERTLITGPGAFRAVTIAPGYAACRERTDEEQAALGRRLL